MFLGHFAIGFASKRAAPRTSLGMLMAAPLLLDLLWPIALLTGLETVKIDPGNTAVTPLDLHDYPYTHSLVMAMVWSVLLGAGYLAFRRNRRASIVIALGVFSHWMLDYVTHRPDLPLYPGSPTSVGLGLWNSRAGTVIAESALFIVGVWIYTTTTRARNTMGAASLWALVAFLSVLYSAVVFGPPPPSPTAIAIGGCFTWLFVLWSWWLDRHRELR